MLICEEGIFVLEVMYTIFVPQTIGIGSLVMRNPIAAKLSMYYTICHCTNHNMEACKSKKEEPTIIITEATS
jgi:hypothetical protein